LIHCSPGVNLFLGNNGEGKTNVLEGILYLCISKSFFVANDAVVVKIGQPGFSASGKIVSDGGIEYEIKIEVEREKNLKTITLNKARIEKASSLIGQFPVVILSTEQSSVTFGTPGDRRRFVDIVISQSSRTYLENLIEYRRILKQRNRALLEMQMRYNGKEDVIEPWNDSLAKVGSCIIRKRMEFINDFESIMLNSYAQLTNSDEKPTIIYTPSFEWKGDDVEAIRSAFAQALQDQFSNEMRVGCSLVGPQRDNIIFKINDLDIKNYASQGQHKTYLVSLKLAEFYYLKDRCNETPILLLDDVLNELDSRRAQRLLEKIAELGQIFITSTDDHVLDLETIVKASPRKFFIKEGRIESVEDMANIH
jgi:DNA replication and repair protein RecF